MGVKLSRVVGENEAGKRLDHLISEFDEITSRVVAQRLIEQGDVLINGRPVKKNHRAAMGEEIIINTPEPEERKLLAEDIPIDIVYEDDDIIVVNKPAGMVTHPAAGNYSGTLVNALLSRGPLADEAGSDRPGIVHRLDKETSGLLVIARNNNAYKSLVEQIKERRVKRTYLALVEGGFTEDSGKIVAPIGRSRTDRKKMAVAAEGGKEAITIFRVKERLDNYTFVEVDLETGRTHQIRVHFRFINRPVVGDKVYGSAETGKALTLKRQFLHAWRLTFDHPRTNEALSFTVPLPDDLASALVFLKDMQKNI